MVPRPCGEGVPRAGTARRYHHQLQVHEYQRRFYYSSEDLAGIYMYMNVLYNTCNIHVHVYMYNSTCTYMSTHVHLYRLLYFTQIFIYFSKPLRLLYSLIIYEIVNFSFFTLYSLLLLSFFLYLKSVPIYVIVHVILLLNKSVLFVKSCRCT